MSCDGLNPAVNSGIMDSRKVSFGNRSAAGELATARLLTVSETCDLQQLNTLAYLAAAIACHRRRQPVKSLLPV